MAAAGRTDLHGDRPHRALRARPGPQPRRGVARAHDVRHRIGDRPGRGGRPVRPDGHVTTMRVAYTVQVGSLLALLWLPSRETLLGSLVGFGAGFAAADTMITKAI